MNNATDQVPKQDWEDAARFFRTGTVFLAVLIALALAIPLVLPGINNVILPALLALASVYGLVDTLRYARMFDKGRRKIFTRGPTTGRPLTPRAVKGILEGPLGPARLVREYGLLSMMLRTTHLRLRDEHGKRVLLFFSGNNMVLFVTASLVPDTPGIDRAFRDSGLFG